ncbi:hypothetical protein BHE74_00031224 [Ensete ventricosum]|uniref:Uncharacterized protein n=1 Tax=Ensete ventricosum TaxID=4639 RepID=A0A444CZP7_ENSVE|nr:hypothetical protein GW17_00046381 [Ensete ventricosum]RWW61708.1 hypothetical protein BHE74_00031224 [Ensete ventricosum]RZR73283.1 hypothetical protein BHM03_00022267 [Ensete ventricosum]
MRVSASGRAGVVRRGRGHCALLSVSSLPVAPRLEDGHLEPKVASRPGWAVGFLSCAEDARLSMGSEGSRGRD